MVLDYSRCFDINVLHISSNLSSKLLPLASMNHLCKTFLSLMLLVYTNVFAQLPSNIGFEDGDFDGWECYTGTRARNTGVITVGSASAPGSRHVMINDTYKNQLDPYGGFPVLCPNGSGHSIKPGDDDSNHSLLLHLQGGRVNRIAGHLLYLLILALYLIIP